MPCHTDVWTDGSREPDPGPMIDVAGAGAHVRDVFLVFDDNAGRGEGHLEDIGSDVEACSGIFASVLTPH